ncbi:FHA domain-containing protein [Micrococcales bacterium 31B]|nr:FHA domain-containing protein [Micrococcales bacterium 31B]
MADKNPVSSQRLGGGWALAYAPGDWYVVAAPSAIVALPSDSDAKVIDELWQAMQQWNTSVSDLINVVTRQRTIPLSLVPDFVVISRQTNAVKVAVRGNHTLDLATVKGTQRASGAQSTTWVEGDVADFTAAQWVANERDATPPTLPLVNGVVRAGALVWTAPEFDWEANAAASGAGGVGSVPPASADSHAAALEAEPNVSTPVAAHQPDDSEAAPAQSVAPLAPAGGSVRGLLKLSTGDVITVDRNVILGRSPKVETAPGQVAPRLVSVPSPKQDISRSHVELTVEGEFVKVMDLGSTNGTFVRRPGERPTQLVPGNAQVLSFGDRVDIGASVYFVFEADA